MVMLHKDSTINLQALAHHDENDCSSNSFGDDDNNEFISSNTVLKVELKPEEDDYGMYMDDENDDDEKKDEDYNEMLDQLAIMKTSSAVEKNNPKSTLIPVSNSSLSSEISNASSIWSGSRPKTFSGFDDYDYMDPYSSFSTQMKNQRKKRVTNCFFPCFPFIASDEMEDTDDEEDDRSESPEKKAEGMNYNSVFEEEKKEENLSKTSSNVSNESSHHNLGEDPNSLNSSLYGKPLTESEHRAVLARLKLAELRNSFSSLEHRRSSLKADEGAGPQTDVSTIEKRGILKKTRMSANPGEFKSKSLSSLMKSNRQLLDESQQPQHNVAPVQRRSLFPTSTLNNNTMPKPKPKKKQPKVKFSSLAKVSTVPGLSDLSPLIKANVWWQRPDYDDFKKAARIITKALLTGGSEIWLSNTNQLTTQYDLDSDDPSENPIGSKWWCKFGHSRRGLEHLCNLSEGKNRQKNVVQAIRNVIDEQRRQRIVHRDGSVDEKRLAQVSMSYTAWAKDLAYASGLADQDAVQKKFGLDVKDRNTYLIQQLKRRNLSNGGGSKRDLFNEGCSVHAGDVVGLCPSLYENCSTSDDIQHDPHLLDANTRSNVIFRMKEQKQKHISTMSGKKKHICNNDGNIAVGHSPICTY